jgi:O-antigen ligase
MIAATTFVVLAISILFLAVAGGGLFPVTVVIIALPLCALACMTTRARPSRPWLELILAAILLFVLFTALPIPPALDPLAGALRHGQNQAVLNALYEAGQIGIPLPESEPWFSLTRNRAGTLRFFLLLAAAFGAALLTASLPPAWKMGFLYFLALTGTAMGIAGYLGQWIIPQGDTLWWFIPLPHAVTSPVGCFLNRNHFGGFVAMLSPVALALAAYALDRRRGFTALFSLALTGIMMAAVFYSLSRGAMLAMGAGLSVTALVIAFRHRAVWGILLLCLMLAGGTALLAHSPAVRERLQGIHNPGEISSVQSRLAEWRESLRVWPCYPVLGAGMNALRMVYPQTRQTSVSARLIASENEYIQLLVEGGLVGVGLFLALTWAVRHRIRDTSAQTGVIGLAVTGALTVTGVHCLFDFPAHLPLYALVIGSLAGLLLSSKVDRDLRARSDAARRSASTSGYLIAILPGAIGLIGTLVILLTQPQQLGNLDNPAYLYTAKYRELHRALIWAPTSPAWLYLGRAMFKEGVNREARDLCTQGETLMTRAVQLDPQNYRLWFELGQVRLSLGDNARATEAFLRAKALRAWMTPPPIPGKN